MKRFFIPISLFCFVVGCSSCYATDVPPLPSKCELFDQQKRCFSWLTSGSPCDTLVDTSCLLCAQEKEYIEKRQPHVEDALQKLIGGDENKVLSKIPTLSFCFSGGGFRAMTSTFGFMLGAKSIGLLDATTYIASLSGSSWHVLNLFSRIGKSGITLEQFREVLQLCAAKNPFDPGQMDFDRICTKLWSVLKERGKIEPVDLLGVLASNLLWPEFDDAYDMTFQELRYLFQSDFCGMPFPLFTLTAADVFPYEWIEVSPFETGSDYLGGYIPTSMFDSYFKAGHCAEKFPEKWLGWFAAAFGSAYNFSCADALVTLAKDSGKLWLLPIVEALIEKYNLYERRVLSYSVANFAWNLNSLPVCSQREFEVSDGGMAFNLPFPPLLKKERGSDIIFVCDASSNVNKKDYPELHYAKAYADRKGLGFPSLDNPKKISEYIAIFEDEKNPGVPTIIYIANPISMPTLGFSYTKAEFDLICDTMKNFVVANKDVIVEAIRKKVA